MKYEYVPRPDIEQHYHIRELIEGQEKRTADKNFHKDREKERSERNDLIKDSKIITATDFWCHKCKKDFKAMAIREVETDWTNTNQLIAFYKSKCDKGHWVIRLITDRNRDGFFQRSKLVALDRGNHYADILQPWESGYELLYGNKNK